MSETPQEHVGGEADEGDRYSPKRVDGQNTPPSPERRGNNWWAVIGGAVLLALVVVAVVLPGARSSDGSATASPTTSSAVPSPPKITSTTVPAPTSPRTSAPPHQPGAVFTEPAGLFCKDLRAKGYRYAESEDYWQAHGHPDNMDADKNGIPCETVYAADEVSRFWAQPVVGADGFSTLTPENQYASNVEIYFEHHTADEATDDLANLGSATGVKWNLGMLLTLGASYCRNWDTEPYDDVNDESGPLSAAGKQDWATWIAPTLGISQTATVQAIESNIWTNYQFVCE